jgi:PilZ domain
MQERRNSFRVTLIATAEVTEIDSGTRLSAQTSDISRNGCYVDTLNPTPPNTDVKIAISHVGQELNVTGKIVYVSPRLGMGIRFDDDMPADQRAILEGWTADSK